MNFFDSLFEKIPILRDIDQKKRKMAAIFLVFVIISVLGIIIDAIANGGGAIALTAVAIGFLLMAVMIIVDFMINKKKPQESPKREEPYFFDDSPGNTDYQDDSYEYYNANDGPQDGDSYDERYSDHDYRDDGGYDERGYDDPSYQDGYDDSFADDRMMNDDDLPQEPEYSVQPEPIQQEPAPRRFGGVFHRGRANENTAVSDQITGRRSERTSYELTPEEVPTQTPREDAVIGSPVMTFGSSSVLRDEVAQAADAVAPGLVPPAPQPDLIGGPVMSIPFRGGSQPEPQPEPQPAPVAYAQPAPIQSAAGAGQSAYRAAYPRQDGRGKEIEEFFDDMSEDELLYSDCVEVWAADAKPAAIRLLKQVESLSDKKMADSLGREAEYINAMLDRIYYFTMLDSIRDNLELKEYNFSAVVKDCLRRFSPFFMEKRIGLLWKGLDINIITDKRWLIFALTQVVFNAVEFTGLGGKIAISAKKEGSLIHLMVDDNGCGISEEDLPKIFMAGFMGDNVPNESGRRTGMGLFITRSVVEKLGGSVTVESTIGKGTRITMILPEKP